MVVIAAVDPIINTVRRPFFKPVASRRPFRSPVILTTSPSPSVSRLISSERILNDCSWENLVEMFFNCIGRVNRIVLN